MDLKGWSDGTAINNDEETSNLPEQWLGATIVSSVLLLLSFGRLLVSQSVEQTMGIAERMVKCYIELGLSVFVFCMLTKEVYRPHDRTDVDGAGQSLLFSGSCGGKEGWRSTESY